MRPRVARGIIAIGNIAVGVVAIAGLSCGLVTLGGASIGLLFAVGGAAFGFGISVGGLAVGSEPLAARRSASCTPSAAARSPQRSLTGGIATRLPSILYVAGWVRGVCPHPAVERRDSLFASVVDGAPPSAQRRDA